MDADFPPIATGLAPRFASWLIVWGNSLNPLLRISGERLEIRAVRRTSFALSEIAEVRFRRRLTHTVVLVPGDGPFVYVAGYIGRAGAVKLLAALDAAGVRLDASAERALRG